MIFCGGGTPSIRIYHPLPTCLSAATSADPTVSAVSQLLADRENIWQQEQEAVADGLKRIATVFSGNQTLTKLPKNGELT